MHVILIALLVLAMLATLAALVRGIVIFLKTKETELMSGNGPSLSGLQQNKAMRARIMFQAIAVLIAVLLLMLARSG